MIGPLKGTCRELGGVEHADGFLREHYIAEFNRRFGVLARELETRSCSRGGCDVDRVFSI